MSVFKCCSLLKVNLVILSSCESVNLSTIKALKIVCLLHLQHDTSSPLLAGGSVDVPWVVKVRHLQVELF